MSGSLDNPNVIADASEYGCFGLAILDNSTKAKYTWSIAPKESSR